MSHNQLRAVHLAERLWAGSADPRTLPDADWDLLLLAAGLNKPRSLPLLVAKKVLDRATRQDGYFAAAAEDDAVKEAR